MALPATDSFTDSNGVQLTTHSASWTLNNSGVTGDFDIQSNALAPDGNFVDYGAHWNADAFDNDQYAEATYLTSGVSNHGIGIAVRCAAGSTLTFYMYYSDTSGSGARYLAKIVAGAWTELGSSAIWSNNDAIRLEAEGTTITPILNSVTDAGIGAQTDGSISSGYAGVSGWGDATVNKIDNWEGGNLGGGSGVIGQIAGVAWASVGQLAGVAEASIGQVAGVAAN